MRLFSCQACGQLLYFENHHCEKCGHLLGYLPVQNQVTALDPSELDGVYVAQAAGNRRYRFCANVEHAACNWLVPEEQEDPFCLACRHNRTVPDLSVPQYVAKWRKIEVAKHRMIYSLLRLGLPLENDDDRPDGLMFDFLADPQCVDEPKVMTGHFEGLITIALAEADDVEREQRRNDLGELYRTLLGHFRHEVGHYYWNVLVRDEQRLDECRAMFGDERRDYGEALKAHYENGPPANWQANFVSAYAASHPWEDFAETFKHYIHIVDSLEMAGAFGIRLRPRLDATGELNAEVDFNPYAVCTIQQMIDAWLPLSFALNNLNRAMGLSDAYPFILSPAVIDKLGFIHGLVHAERRPRPLPAPAEPDPAAGPQAVEA